MLELFPDVARVMPAALPYLAEIHYPHHCVAGLKSTAKRNHTDKRCVEFQQEGSAFDDGAINL